MARITTTNQKKNTIMPGIAYPPIARLATGPSYPASPDLFRYVPLTVTRTLESPRVACVAVTITVPVWPGRERAGRARARR